MADLMRNAAGCFRAALTTVACLTSLACGDVRAQND
jgi:hypothetical protein